MNSVSTRKTAAVFLLAATFCVCAEAWPFGGDKPRERVVAKLDKAKAADFQKAVSLRQMRAEEIRVLSRLVDEKTSEAAGFDRDLRAMCSMSDDASYSYNPTNRTLYLVSTNAIHGATADAPAKIPHHAFASEEEAASFLRALGAKQITLRQIETFREVIAEKRTEYSLTDKYLAEKYGIKPDRNYRFDDKTGELFDLTPPKKDVKDKPSAKSGSANAASAAVPSPAKKTKD